jgi:hypothetical protein
MGRFRSTCHTMAFLALRGLTLLLMIMVIAGCGTSGTTTGVTGTQQSFTQAFNNQIDILWVVDNSGSMAPLQANMTANFQSFIQNFQSVGYDYRMAMTATDAYKANSNFVGYSSANSGLSLFLDGGYSTPASGTFVILPTTPNLDTVFLDNATTGIGGSGDERAFSSMMTTLNNTSNVAFPRPTAFFAIIILSDEDDFSNFSRTESSWGSNAAADHCYYDTTMDTTATTAYSGTGHVSTCAGLNPQTPPDSVSSYEGALDTLTGSTGSTRRWSVSTIAVLDSACQLSHSQSPVNNDSAFVSVIGQRYIQISQDTQGYQGSICDASYANSLSSIASNIVALSTQFFLTQTPQAGSIAVTVNGATAPQDPNNGWEYNSGTNSIMFFGSSVPPQGAQIVVTFDPAIVQAMPPLEISNFQIASVSETSVTLTWTTNNPSNSVMSIAPYPSTNYTVTTDNAMTTNHTETITGLTNFTLYNVFVSSTDASGSSASTAVTSFRTLF